MQDGLYVALSAQIALEKRLNTIADNVANASTVGFRATGVRFQDVVDGVDGGSDEGVSFASSGQTYVSQAAGAFTQTGNPLDFAIKGEAYFAIQTPAGPVMTRDGRFQLTANGQLTSLQGYPVLDAGGQPVQLDPQKGAPRAGADGGLTQDGLPVGAIGLFAFNPGVDFERFGNSGFLPKGAPKPVVDRLDAGVTQGYVEESNVNPVQEMTRLISVQRAFEDTAALMRLTDSSYTDAIKSLGSK